MDYFHSHSLPSSAGIVAAWDSQLAAAKEIPSLRRMLAERGSGIFPEFAARYAEIRALPRSARRSLQRRLGRSNDLTLPAEWRRRLAYSIAGAALLLALSQAPAADAGSITVNAKSPEIKVDGLCSLKEAIIAANTDNPYDGCAAGSGPDTIMLPGGAQSVTTSSDIVFGSYTGLPLITSEITIAGNNSRISRKSSTFFRLFAVDTGGDLTLDRVILSGGVASDDGTTPGNAFGGAILNKGSLTLQNSTITGNFAERGGAILNDGSVEIEHSVFSKNTGGFGGGAIYNRTGTVVITDNSVITGNKADYGGAVWSSPGATTTIDNSTVSKNSVSRSGGAVFNANGYVIILDGSLITGNKAPQEGGGVFNNSGLTHIYDSTVSKNSAGDRGGGVFISNSGTLVMTNSDILGNKAGESGGGLYRAGTAYSGYGNTFSKNKAPMYADHFP